MVVADCMPVTGDMATDKTTRARRHSSADPPKVNVNISNHEKESLSSPLNKVPRPSSPATESVDSSHGDNWFMRPLYHESSPFVDDCFETVSQTSYDSTAASTEDGFHSKNFANHHPFRFTSMATANRNIPVDESSKPRRASTGTSPVDMNKLRQRVADRKLERERNQKDSMIVSWLMKYPSISEGSESLTSNDNKDSVISLGKHVQNNLVEYLPVEGFKSTNLYRDLNHIAPSNW